MIKTMIKYTPIITGKHIKSARTLTGLNMKEFQKLANIQISTLFRLEKQHIFKGSVETYYQAIHTLEKLGIQFKDEAGGIIIFKSINK